MVAYLCMTLISSFLLRWLERRMDGSDSYELVRDDQLTMTAGVYNVPGQRTPFEEHNPEYEQMKNSAEYEEWKGGQPWEK